MPDNTVTIVGNLTQDPEMRFTPNGVAMVSLSIAVNRRRFNRDTNSWEDGDASFFNATCWRDLAENVSESLRKGTRVVITGSLKQWLDDQGDLWEELVLSGRPGAAFTAGTGRHSGLETTLRQLVHWMLACGMVIVGLPWSERMRTSGSYYGATAAGGVTDDDLAQARDLGLRLAQFADLLKTA